jgi:DnaJ-class molecular chaperone
MICERCHGSGFVRQYVRFLFGDLWEVEVKPCPECSGCGRTYCCEGERPDEAERNTRHNPVWLQ